MLESRTIRLSDGGAVSLHRGSDESDTILLQVTARDGSLMLGVVLTRDETVAVGRELLRPAGDPAPFG